MNSALSKQRFRVVEILLLLANATFALLFSLIFLEILWGTTQRVPASLLKYILMFALWIASIVGLVCLYNKLSQKTWGNICARGIVIVLLGIQMFYVWCVYSQVDSDAYAVNYIAYHFVRGDLSNQSLFWTEYLSYYTNNMPITQLLVSAYRCYLPATLEDSWLLLSGLAAFLADLAIFFVYKLVKLLLGSRMAIVAFFLSVPMIALSESGSIFYTDIVALWTIPAALYILLRIKNTSFQKRWIRCCVAAAVLAFGTWTKPQVAVSVIALCIVWVLDIIRPSASGKVKLALLAELLLVFFIFTFLLQTSTQVALNTVVGKDLVERNEFPMQHFIAMGLNRQSNGAYDERDVQETKEKVGIEAKKKFLHEKIATRIETMGVGGLAIHLNKKLIQGVGNGTFTQGKTWKGVLLNTSPTAVTIQNWFVVDTEGWKMVTSVWIQSGYLLIMLCITHSSLYALLSSKKERKKELFLATNIIRIALIGIVLFLLLLECNLRYLYTMMPLMIVLCVYDIKNVLSVKTHRLKEQRFTI
ncbi:hypothetical protein [Ruthenibacterium lactatiformans]|uniref:hypothetical protein n=1 Tax=Ruthenibacterium lactatiformans TaxID=1550024 RepID=UPI0022E731CE|nr:hypothetical protein [Ruthenibacterium lactatiformans]